MTTTDELNAREIARFQQRLARRQMSERFNNVAPFLNSDGAPIMELERNAADYPEQVGKLRTGNTWLTVERARDLRDWLDKAIPPRVDERIDDGE